MNGIDSFLAVKPLVSKEACGDTGVIKIFDGKVFLALVDALGHGEKADKIARSAKAFLEENYKIRPLEVLNGLHKCLQNTRGAVAGVAHLDMKMGRLEYAGVGNITAIRFGESREKIISREGIIGYLMPPPEVIEIMLEKGDLLILHTDGIMEHNAIEAHPEVLTGGAERVAKEIVRRFARQGDDAACLALRLI